MAPGLDSQTLDLVFSSRPDILSGIAKAADSPSRIALFNDIATFVHEKIQTSADEPALKRRRLDDAANGRPAAANGVVAVKHEPPTATTATADVSAEPVLLEVKELSVSIPQRKKYDLCFTAEHLYARVPGTTAPAQGIVYAWRDIAHVFFLPVPEKTTAQYNYVIIPRNSCLPASKNAPVGDDPLVFAVSGAPPKQGTIQGPESAQAASVSDSYRTLLDWAISTRLRAVSSQTTIVATDPNVFQSANRQMLRPGEKPVHVKAYRGPKDGYIFFLPTGILWGFKKPLLFIPLDRVVAVSYTNVLQRTFNIVVEVFVLTGEGDADGATDEIEFAMLDPIDHSGIDQNYIRRHRLQDRSMAEQRKAKLELAENIRAAAKKEEEGGEDAGQDAGGVVDDDGGIAASGDFAGMSALQIAEIEAERQLQDAEDEEEEDFVPDSDGDSGGSGSLSEEDSDGDGEDGGDDDDEDEDDEGDEEEEEEEEEAEEPEPEPAPKPAPTAKPAPRSKPAPKATQSAPKTKPQPAPKPQPEVKAKPAVQAVQAPPPPVEEDLVMADSGAVDMSTGFDDDDEDDEHLDVGA